MLDFNAFNTVYKTCRVSPKAPGNIITPMGRLSYPNFLRAVANNKDKPDDKKFSGSILIPGVFDIAMLKEAASKAAFEKWGPKTPAKLKSPFLEAGDYKDKEGYEPGWVLIRASSKDKPGVATPDGQPTDQSSEIYAGRWCVMSLRAFAYEQQGNRGVSFGLQNIHLLDHDEPIGSRRISAEEEFAPVTTSEKTATAVESLF